MASQRILIVDDESILLTLMARVLRDEGFEVDTADNGARGCEMAASQRYDAVVTNSRMPGMNGAELIDALRGSNPGLPILHISGGRPNSDGYDAGFPASVPTLWKPFDPQAFLQAVKAILPGA